MKKSVSRFLALMTAVLMLICALPLSVFATAVSYTAKVGEACSFLFHQDGTDTVSAAAIASGSAPGLGVAIIDGNSVALAGTPTTAGTYELSVSVETQNGGLLQYAISLTVQEEPPVSDGIPVITKQPGGETVFETDSPIFIADADNTKQYVWELLTAQGATIACSDLVNAYAGLTVTGFDTNTLQLGNIPLALNGSKVRCLFVGTEQSIYSDYAAITVRSAKEAKPVVTKNPTSEKVKEGGLCQFVARAKYTQYYDWELISPDGTYYEADTLEDLFAGLKVTGEYTDTLTLRNIPAELDGYRARCKFYSAAVVASAPAYLYVIPNPETTEPTEETTEATEEPTEAATEAPTEAPTEAETVPAEAVTEAPTEAPVQTEAPAPEAQTPEAENGNSGIAPVAIAGGAAIVIAAIAAYVILKLKKR